MSKQKNRLNFRSVYKVIDEVELLPVETIGTSREILSGNEYRAGVQFDDFKATDVHLRDDTMLENLKDNSSIKHIGDIREVRYTNIDDIVKQL